MNELFFLLAIGLVSFFYSSIGHGGASGYLLLMALFGFVPSEMRPSALILNILVSCIAFFSYYRTGYFNRHKLFPFILGSIPASFLGALIHIDFGIYKILLGIILIIGIIRMVLTFKTGEYSIRPFSYVPAFMIGSAIGFLSGLIGIGGGILLSPVLILMRWATIKETACLSAAFIVLNSVSGLTGLMVTGFSLSTSILLFLLAALAGGLTGSYVGSRHLAGLTLKYILAGVLLIASLKLFVG